MYDEQCTMNNVRCTMSLSTKQSTLFVFRELIEPHKVPSDTYFPENTSHLTPHSSFLTPNTHSSFGITLNITHFHPILFHITHGAPLGLALNLSCGFPFARPRLSRCLTHTGVGISPIQVSVSHPYTQRGLTRRCSFTLPLVLLGLVVVRW